MGCLLVPRKAAETLLEEWAGSPASAEAVDRVSKAVGPSTHTHTHTHICTHKCACVYNGITTCTCSMCVYVHVQVVYIGFHTGF